MIHKVDLTGDYRTTVYAATRRLLAGGADPADTIATYRGGKLSMSGAIGQLAKWTVRENDHGNPTFQLVPYRPFSSDAVRPRTAETGLPGAMYDLEAKAFAISNASPSWAMRGHQWRGSLPRWALRQNSSRHFASALHWGACWVRCRPRRRERVPEPVVSADP